MIIAEAGKVGAVTIATNMAGRGVDIKLTDETRALGGLAILGTERHESRRIDNQLRGRSGRQGDVGESQFYLSLEDNLLRIFGSDRIKLIMEKLGIEEGEHIESKMVTRAVENAQKKVESLHFESRKHLLEYDDVANEQRKVIYNFRNDLLNYNFEIDAKVEENRADYLNEVLNDCEIFDGGVSDDFNLEKLTATIKEDLRYELDYDTLKQATDYNSLKETILGILKNNYDTKFSIAADEQKSEIQRIIYLQILDNAWREHLYLMDTLKTGIGLRGYNQKDPLVEYKKESYNLFIELISGIKNEVTKVLFTIQLAPQDVQNEEKILDDMVQGMQDDLKNSITNSELEILNNKKVARNDPCPCGSGKKFKHCCGISGPKKGLIAK